MHDNVSPFRDRDHRRILFVGILPTLLNLSLSGTLHLLLMGLKGDINTILDWDKASFGRFVKRN